MAGTQPRDAAYPPAGMPPTPAAAGMPLVRAVNVMKSFHGNQVLKGIDMDVHRGEVVCLLGPSGSGSTASSWAMTTGAAPSIGSTTSG